MTALCFVLRALSTSVLAQPGHVPGPAGAFEQRMTGRDRGVGYLAYTPTKKRLTGRWHEMKCRYIGAFGSGAAIKQVRAKRLSWEF